MEPRGWVSELSTQYGATHINPASQDRMPTGPALVSIALQVQERAKGTVPSEVGAS